jgi:voltage-gated potassium channel
VNIFGLKRLSIAIALMCLSILLGMGGFIVLEGYDWIDAFYMSIITIGTVGFNEVHELSPEGKVFTSLYIILNLCLFAFIVSVITQYLFEGELKNTFKEIRAGKKIKRMKNHVIVCGYGRNGSKAVEELLKSKKKVVVIEADKSLIDDKTNHPDLAFIEDNAIQDEVLVSAGIGHASAIITTLPSDADNVFISLTARQLNPKVKIISRASQAHSESKLKRAGADHVIMPEVIGGFHMASMVTNPDMMHFSDLIRGEEDANLRIKEFSYEQFSEDFRNKTLGGINMKKNKKVLVVAYVSPVKGFVFNPDDDIQLQPGGSLILLADRESLDQFKKKYIS